MPINVNDAQKELREIIKETKGAIATGPSAGGTSLDDMKQLKQQAKELKDSGKQLNQLHKQLQSCEDGEKKQELQGQYDAQLESFMDQMSAVSERSNQLFGADSPTATANSGDEPAHEDTKQEKETKEIGGSIEKALKSAGKQLENIPVVGPLVKMVCDVLATLTKAATNIAYSVEKAQEPSAQDQDKATNDNNVKAAEQNSPNEAKAQWRNQVSGEDAASKSSPRPEWSASNSNGDENVSSVSSAPSPQPQQESRVDLTNSYGRE